MPCPLNRRVPQDVWDAILDMKPRDRNMSSPTAALIKSIPHEFFYELRARRLHAKCGWKVHEDIGTFLMLEPRSGHDPYVRWSLFNFGLAPWGAKKQVHALYMQGTHPYPPCVIMSLGVLKGEIYHTRPWRR